MKIPEAHPYADLFPLIERDALAALADDIKQNGQLTPIWMYQGKILDGRNRYRACVLAGVEPQVREYEGTEESLLPFVVSLNMHRRHLSESQRASVGAKLETMGHGRSRTEKDATLHLTSVRRSEAAELLNVSERSIAKAKKVQNEGAPELVQAVEEGLISVSVAEKALKAPSETQRKLADLAANGSASEVKAVLKDIESMKSSFSDPFKAITPEDAQKREEFLQKRAQREAKEHADRVSLHFKQTIYYLVESFGSDPICKEYARIMDLTPEHGGDRVLVNANSIRLAGELLSNFAELWRTTREA